MANPNTAQFPGAIPTDEDLFVGVDNGFTSLTAALTSGATTATVDNGAALSFPSILRINQETVKCTDITGNTLTIERGFLGTTPAAHKLGDNVFQYIFAYHHNQMAEEIKALATALGINSGNVLSSSATGISSASWQVDNGNNGPRIKNNSGTLEVRNAADSALAALSASTITSNGQINANSLFVGSDGSAKTTLSNTVNDSNSHILQFDKKRAAGVGQAADTIGQIVFESEDDGGNNFIYGIIRGKLDDPTDLSELGAIVLASDRIGLGEAAKPAYCELFEKSTNPPSPANGVQGNFYIKGDLFVIQFNDAGTDKYYTLDLTQATGTPGSATWTATQTAP